MLTPSSNSRAAAIDSSKIEDEDTADDTILSPPPSSSVSSVNPDVLGDEIVVGAGAHASTGGGEKTSPAVVSEPGDVGIVDREDSEKPVAHYPKRKRASLYSDLGEDKLEESLLSGADDVEERPASRAASVRRHGLGSNKSVLLGYWRDSPVPKSPGKHAVVGFMDVRDRLRTRIQQTTRSNDSINTRAFPVPPGPGGSWVTFERVVFEKHLVGLDHNQVKEFVKLRTSADLPNEDEETRKKNDLTCVEEAIRRVANNPPPETSQPPAIAYGAVIPESAQTGQRPDSKRRRTGSATGSIAVSRESLTPQTPAPAPAPAPAQQAQGLMSQPLPPRQQSQHVLQPHQMQMQMAIQGALPPPLEWDTSPNLPGSRPTRIAVGSWSKSEATTEVDKGAAHAVFGILGANDMFRVKLVRETLDGKYFESNFPTGAGALWINYDEVIFLPHLKELTRPEMKEYCRVRQCQIDGGEKPEDKVANETRAVCIAQRRVAFAGSKTAHGGHGANNRHTLPHMDGGGPNGIKQDAAHELRYPRRDVIHDELRGPRSGPEADFRTNGRSQSADHLQRSNQAARQEILKLEGRYNHPRQQMHGNPHDNRAAFHDNVDRLNKVWQSQGAQRMQVPGMSMQAPHVEQPPQVQHQQPHGQPPQQQSPLPMAHPGMNAAPMENFKEYNGVRYERRQTGPFGGKLASTGALINISTLR